MGKLTKEEREKAFKHIRECDKAFDGWYSPGGGYIQGDKPFAYNMLRVMTLELMDKLDD